MAQEHSLTCTAFLIFHYSSLKMQLLKKKHCNELQSLNPPTSNIALLSELWCFTSASFGNENSDIVSISELEALSTSILDSNVWDIFANISSCHRITGQMHQRQRGSRMLPYANNSLFFGNTIRNVRRR